MLSCALAGGSGKTARVAAVLTLTLILAVMPASLRAAHGSPSYPASLSTIPFKMTAASIVPQRGHPEFDAHGLAWPAQFSGFLGLEFMHDTVTPNAWHRQIVNMVSPDTLGACIQHLQDYGTRHTNSPEVLHAGRWLVRRLLGYGYADTLLQSIKQGGKANLAPRNVIATKEGVTRPEFRIVIGGHYDSITYGESVPATIEAPGADDDASGTAGTLEIARILRYMDLDATVQFVLFAGHEQGLYGSLEFTRNLVAEGVPRDKLFFINLDMIGNADSPDWKVRVYTDDRSLPLAQLLGRNLDAYTSVQPLVGGNRYADQTSFQERGYPGIFVHEESFSPNYHSRRDLLEHLEMDYEAEVVKGVLAMVLDLALMADPPENVAAFETLSGDLRVEWEHSTDADLLRYHVELLDGDGQPIGEHSTVENHLTLDHQAAQGVSWIRVRAEDVLGKSDPSDAVFVGSGKFIVQGATPNPATSECSFDIFIPGAGDPVGTSLRIFDASGRLVSSIRNEQLPRGSQTLKWNTTSADGAAVPSGIYFYIVEVDGIGSNGGKIMVLR